MGDADVWGRSVKDRELWGRAGSLEEAGELTAQWLEGRIRYHPMNHAPQPDEETDGLRDVLARLNRAGYVTDFSQPAVPIRDGYGQRASVGGVCREETVERVQDLLAPTDLVWLGFAPGAEDTLRVPVTLVEGGAYTWVGIPFGEEELERYTYEGCSRDLVDNLSECWTLYVLDPVWGRTDLLWEALAAALTGGESAPRG